jgi:DDE superfamily endonuclease
MDCVVVDVVTAELDRVHARIGGRFTRAEPRSRAREYMCGLVAALERKNGWTLAERSGEVSPDGMQRLLRRADWDVDGVRDDLRDYVIEHLGDRAGVLIVDDTGFLKKGTRSAGVQRQYSGTAGRTENCQIGTFLAYASARGHALVDRELYLPESWTDDRERCRAAGIPEGAEFTTKPRQAMAMLARAFDAGVPFAWVTADEAYGQAKYLRVWLEAQDAAYVLATRRNDALTTVTGHERRADDPVAVLETRAWRRISAGAGAHGRGEYGWARVPIRIGWAPGRGHAAGPPLDQPPGPGRLLRLPRPTPFQPRRPDVDRRGTVADRGVLSAGQERSGSGVLPGPHLAGLVRPHHLVDARPRLARGISPSGRKRHPRGLDVKLRVFRNDAAKRLLRRRSCRF